MARKNILFPVQALGLGALVLLAACETMRVASDYDRSATFDHYRTFALIQRPHQQPGNPLVVQRTQDAIRGYLVGRGYMYVADPAQADFAVDFTIGSRERTQIQSYPAPWGGPGWSGRRGWWGSPYWGDTIDVRQFTEGTLSIDVFDGKTSRPVWHGWAQKTLSRSDIENSQGPIQRAVSAVLEKFPPH